MANALPFSIPRRHQPALRALAKLPDHNFQALVLHLREHAERVRSVNALKDAIGGSGVLDGPTSDRLVSALLGLYGLHTSHQLGLAPVLKQASHDADLNLKEAEADFLHARLTQLIAISRIQILAKAVDVLGEQANLFHTSRILTDLRPVFSPSLAEAIQAAVITNTLHLSYYDDAGQRKSLFLSMSSRHLAQLQSDIGRAEVKLDSLREVAERAGIEIVEDDNEGHDQ